MVPRSLRKELPDITDERVGGLHGGEMAAAVEFRPVHEVVFEFAGSNIQGNTATPVGTVERSLAPPAPACSVS